MSCDCNVTCLFIVNKKKKKKKFKRKIKLRKIDKRKRKILVFKVFHNNAIDNFISIPNILFNSLDISVANYSFLSNIILSGNLCNFYTLSLNNYTTISTNISSIFATKCVILDNLSQTTRITFCPATNSNLVMKFTIKCVHSFCYDLNS